MTTPTEDLSLLDAVNQLLSAVGSARVQSLTNTNPEAQEAEWMVGQVCREVQQRNDWQFNREFAFPIDPDPTTGEIHLPANTDTAVAGTGSAALGLVQRGNRMYSKTLRSYAIRATVYLDIAFVLPFEDVPGPIKNYVVALAGRRFGTSRVPDTSTYRFTKELENDAFREALEFDGDSDDRHPVFRNGHFRDMRGHHRLPNGRPGHLPGGGQAPQPDTHVTLDGGEEG